MANFTRVITTSTPIEFAKIRSGYQGGSIWNDGEEDVNILFDRETDASETDFNVTIRPGSYFEVPVWWVGRITAWSAADSVINVGMRDETAFDVLEGLD